MKNNVINTEKEFSLKDLEKSLNSLCSLIEYPITPDYVVSVLSAETYATEVKDETDEDSCIEAEKQLKVILKHKKNLDGVRKELKDFPTQVSNWIQGKFNLLVNGDKIKLPDGIDPIIEYKDSINGQEEYLKSQISIVRDAEARKRAEKISNRLKQIEELGIFVQRHEIENLSDEIFEVFKEGKKAQIEKETKEKIEFLRYQEALKSDMALRQKVEKIEKVSQIVNQTEVSISEERKAKLRTFISSITKEELVFIYEVIQERLEHEAK